MNEEMRRLYEKASQWGDRPLTGRDLACLIDKVRADMQEAHPGPSPYDLSAARSKISRARGGLAGGPGPRR